ncbi:sugar kinase [Bacillus sp. AL-1R]
MSQLDIITFGEAMAMFIADKSGKLFEINHYTRALAGAETNTAIGFSRLGFKTGWASKVGKDAFGEYIIHYLQNEGVCTDQVLIDENFPTGFQIKSRVTEGDPEVQYFRKGSAASHLGVSDFNINYFLKAKHLHMTGIPLGISDETREFSKHALECMSKAGKTVSFDPNLRPSLWTSQKEMIEVTNECAFKSDYVLPGIHEGEVLTGYTNPRDIASFYLEKGVKLVVVKLGSKGAFYKTDTEEGIVAGYEVREVVDTVGAGDGFAVGVVSGLLERLPIREAVLRGNAIGALAVQSSGDSEGYPTREKLESYMKQSLLKIRL